MKELAKAKKKYYDCEQVAHAVREKADIEAKWVHHGAVHVCVVRGMHKNKNVMTKQMVYIVRKNANKENEVGWSHIDSILYVFVRERKRDTHHD